MLGKGCNKILECFEAVLSSLCGKKKKDENITTIVEGNDNKQSTRNTCTSSTDTPDYDEISFIFERAVEPGVVSNIELDISLDGQERTSFQSREEKKRAEKWSQEYVERGFQL